MPNRVRFLIDIELPFDPDFETQSNGTIQGEEARIYEASFSPAKKQEVSVEVRAATPEHPEEQVIHIPKQNLGLAADLIQLFRNINEHIDNRANTRPIQLSR